MSANKIRENLLTIVDECLEKGPGFAQEGVVLREAAEKLQLQDLQMQQSLLTCWNDLFREGILSWGYNIDNPNAPFFHKSAKQQSA